MAVKVLILEDNPVARMFLCRVVRESFSDTLAITEAGDLEAGRAQIGLTGGARGMHGVDPFKLILVDLELPDGNGMELLAELSEYPATKVVTTLYSDDDHLFPALQCGADGYLLKEDRFEVLVEELQKIVRGQPPLSPAIARRLLTHFRHGTRPEVRTELPRGARGDTAAHALRPNHSNAHSNTHSSTQASTNRDTLGNAHREIRPELRPGSSGFATSSVDGASRPVMMEKVPEHDRLTPRESEVLTFLSKGFTIKEIASLMGIKWFTVNDHIKSIYKKLNVSSRAEAAVLATKPGLV